jgi:hypothetical protein
MMFLALIMAFVTGVNLLTAAKAEPTVGFCVVAAASAFGELGARDETECFFLAPRLGGGREVRGGDAEEFDFRDEEREFVMAFAADVGSCFAADGDDSWRGVGRGAL